MVDAELLGCNVVSGGVNAAKYTDAPLDTLLPLEKDEGGVKSGLRCDLMEAVGALYAISHVGLSELL